MRAEKKLLTGEYVARLNASPFFIVVGYQGLKVAHLSELRKRLTLAGAEIHVVKNTVFNVAAKEAGIGELNGSLAGQMAVVTGKKDIFVAAKVLKNFAAEFDIAIATPEAMAEVRKLGRVLGPRGLMPNPKTGTVTDDVAKAVKEFKAGRVEFKIDKAGNVHVVVGKASFKPEQLEENARAVIEAVAKARPNSLKGAYINSCTLSATMSPPVRVDVREFATH